MAIPNTPGDLERAKYREVQATPGTVAIAVTNPDGTPIAGGSGGGDTSVNLDKVGGASVALGQTTKSASIPVVSASDSDYLDLPFTTGVTTGAQVLLNDTDVSQYSSFAIVWTGVGVGLAASVQFAPVAAGTYTVNSATLNRSSSTAGPSTTGVSAGIVYEGPIIGPFMRLNITILTSGTATGFIRLHKRPFIPHVIFATPGSGTTGPGKAEDVASAAGDMLFGIGAIRRDTPVANANVSNDGDYTNVLTDNFGMAWVNDRSAPVGKFLVPTSNRITTNVTTTPTAATCWLSSITVCVEAAGTTSTLTVQDKSGTPIVLIKNLSTAAILGNGEITYNFQTPVLMTGGIDIITAGAAAATVDVFTNYYQ